MVDPATALLLFFALVLAGTVLAWPRRGVVAWIRRARRMSERVLLEDALKHLHACERGGVRPSLESLAGRLEITRGRAATLLARLGEMGLVDPGAAGSSLTPEGRTSALRLVRTHRLWERYLADRTGVPAAEWHDRAEEKEHLLSPEEADALAVRLGNPRWDPHGDPIPTAAGELPPVRGMSLLAAEPGRSVEVVHLEDEPPEIFQRLLDEGLAPGERLHVRGRGEGGVEVESQGRRWTVDPVSAHNVTVQHLPAGTSTPGPRRTLAGAERGAPVRVTGLAPGCRGTQRRRLLDLGLVRGTVVVPELVSSAGDPVAYRIRGALVALRREQASWVLVEPVDEDEVAASTSEEVA
jgi:DtxR family Mn-dependent transcriptional regulator